MAKGDQTRQEAEAMKSLLYHAFGVRDYRYLRTVSIGLKPVVLKVKVPRWRNTTTGEEFEQSPPPLPSPTRKSRARSRG